MTVSHYHFRNLSRAISFLHNTKMLPIIIKTYRLTGYYSTLNHNKTEPSKSISNHILMTIEVALITYMIFHISTIKS